MATCAFLLGPTGSGKTGLCVQLADLPIEIINADSLQMYRQLRIGNARPPDELLARIPHHLLGFLDLESEMGCGEFFRQATILIDDIHRRGRWPLVVGGAPFYIRSLLYGLPTIPPVPAGIRNRLDGCGNEFLFQRLQQVDPLSATRIQSQDHQRLVRALEVYEACGRPLSSFPVATTFRPGQSFLLLGLDWPRAQLYQRINQRLQQMQDAGLKEELLELQRQGYAADTPAFKGIGYREFFRDAVGQDWEHILALIARNSRRLAKRQLTFYRRLPNIDWLSAPRQFPLVRQRLLSFFDRKKSGSMPSP